MKDVLLSIAHPMRKLYWRIARPNTFGVKVAVFTTDGAHVFLVRHRYGAPALMLPGGAIERGESAEQAARREIREELHVTLEDVRLCHVFRSDSEGKRDTVYLFAARSDQQPVADPSELVEVVRCPLDALPDAVSPATRRRLGEIASGAYPDVW